VPLPFPCTPRAVEERIDAEDQNLARLSTETLRYMHDYGEAWEGWLRRHRGNLLFLAENEFDLLEAIRLSARLNNVDGNIVRTGRRNERIRSHLLGRELRG